MLSIEITLNGGHEHFISSLAVGVTTQGAQRRIAAAGQHDEHLAAKRGQASPTYTNLSAHESPGLSKNHTILTVLVKSDPDTINTPNQWQNMCKHVWEKGKRSISSVLH